MAAKGGARKRTTPSEGKLFFKIGEAGRITELEPYVLRYWETEFAILRPRKTPTGQRVYSKKDIQIILKIKDLLYVKGLTIAGARRVMKEEGKDRKSGSLAGRRPPGDVLSNVKSELRAILTLLKHGA